MQPAPSITTQNPAFAKGQEFSSVAASQLAVRTAAAREGWNAKVAETNALRCIMICAQPGCNCRLRVKCTKNMVVLTRLNLEHKCLGRVAEGNRSSNGNHALLVSTIKSVMIVQSDTSAAAIRTQLKHSLGYEASDSAVYKAKNAILYEAFGDASTCVT
ncbi:hypothetical protein OC842_006620 [Tilletia horrida]|uniref:Transposase MuDR plant domain-containing protein n=1 Tax=Tilletia horrida TaxID=155126 RepID=A0AAN6G5S5_9BASI|nr:hypothetical protein OC842_006620 [Tilletia horrida]